MRNNSRDQSLNRSTPKPVTKKIQKSRVVTARKPSAFESLMSDIEGHCKVLTTGARVRGVSVANESVNSKAEGQLRREIARRVEKTVSPSGPSIAVQLNNWQQADQRKRELSQAQSK